MTTLSELKASAAAWKKEHDALVNEINADEGDTTEAQSARFDKLWEEADVIKTEFAAQGFDFLFRETAETIIAG